MDASESSVSRPSKRAKRSTATIWEKFTKVDINGKSVAVCNECGKKYAYDYGTSNMHRHMILKHGHLHDDEGLSQLDTYLAEKRMDGTMQLDVLGYWKTNSNKYTILSLMARDILSIPITTVASESCFSIGGQIISKYRSSITPENAEALLCTRSWLWGSEGLEREVHGDEDMDNDIDSILAAFGNTDNSGNNLEQETYLDDVEEGGAC